MFNTPITSLNIDIETRSGADLSETGVYKYVEDEHFGVQLFCVSVNGEKPPMQFDLANGDVVPKEIIEALKDEKVAKIAYNASFERICLSRHLGFNTGEYLSPVNWHCTRVLCASSGLPMSLDAAGKALDISHKKLEEGKELIKFFSTPNRRTGEFNEPRDHIEKWEAYKAYNLRDVVAEMEIAKKVGFALPAEEQKNYVVDQRINDRGVGIDLALCQKAIEFDAIYTEELEAELALRTGLANPNSVKQFKDWLNAKFEEHGLEPVVSLEKKVVAEILTNEDLPDEIRQALLMKQKLGKTSTTKFEKMINCVCADGRARGLFQFLGAPKTGRFAGKLVQLQNLTKNKEPNILEIREALLTKSYEEFAEYGDVSDLLSQLVRSAIIPTKGHVFVDADFAQIEARVIAWLAVESWRLEAFNNNEDIYCKSAEEMFKKPVVKNGVNGELRAKGKVAELACGYGGGVNAMLQMGGKALGLTEDELSQIVTDWRKASPKITGYWKAVNDHIFNRLAALESPQKTDEQARLLSGRSVLTCFNDDAKVGLGVISAPVAGYDKPFSTGNVIYIKLPSDRRLLYTNARTGLNKKGFKSIMYKGNDKGHFAEVESYGAKFVENITQATARDILCFAMQNLEKCGFPVVMHIHDEVIVEVPEELCRESLKQVEEIMRLRPSWAKSLPLEADAYLSPCMLKDGFDPTLFDLEIDKIYAKQECPIENESLEPAPKALEIKGSLDFFER